MTEIFEGFLNRVRRNGLARAHNFFVRVNTTSNLANSEQLKTISFMCNKVVVPGKNINTLDFTVKPGVTQKIASYESFNEPLAFNFYCSPDLSEKRFFENWMNLAVDPTSRDANYYDEYAKFNTVTIFALPKSFSASVVDENTFDEFGNYLYYVKFYECYPIKIGSMELANSNEDNLLELEVEMAYKYFRTSTELGNI